MSNMDIAHTSLIDDIPHFGKLPPDKCQTENTNVFNNSMLLSGASIHVETDVLQTLNVDDDFQEVQSKRSKRNADGEVTVRHVKNTSVDVSSFGSTALSNNRFQLLGQLNVEVNNNQTRRKVANNEENISQKNSGKLGKAKFCPPIILHDVNVKKLVDQLNQRTPKIAYKIINSSRNKSKLYFEDLSAHIEMMEILRTQNIRSYSFTPPELKRVSVVIRGLYYQTEVSEIKSSLDAIAPNTVEKVSKLITQHSAKNEFDTGLFIVTLLQGKKSNYINFIKYILNQSISWETPRSKKREIQCFRCQAWGHSARNCNSKFRCVKCNLDHQPGFCNIKRGESAPICVNCGESGHVANYKGCSFYKTFIKKKKELLEKTKNKRAKIENNVNNAVLGSQFVKENVSFASHFHQEQNNRVPSGKPLPPIVEQFLKLGEYFNDPKTQTLESKILNFINSYQSMQLEEARNMYGNLLGEVLSKYGPK